MRVKTLLNCVWKHKSFVYEEVTFKEEARAILVQVRARKNGRALCSGCEQAGGVYDHLPERAFAFVPIWGFAVSLLYALRRVNCARCGITVERVPWATGKERQTTAFACYLAEWARDLSWKRVGERFKTSWYQVRSAVAYVVEYGKENRVVRGVKALGVDEIAWSKGHRYLSMVYQLDEGCRRLLWIGRERTEESLRGFFGWFGESRTEGLRFICSDLWKPYLNVIRERAKEALHIADRFHVMVNINKGLDEVRKEEGRRLKEEGQEVELKESRWCILKRVEHLTERQAIRLQELLKLNLKTVRAYLMKEDFQRFWEYRAPGWARKFLEEWCTRAMRSRIRPMQKVARTLKKHQALLINWFKAEGEYSCGIVEGLNNKCKTSIKIAYGYRHVETLELVLYHTLGRLPVPPLTHKFF
jgi:transposase